MLEFLLGAGLVERIEDTRLAPLTGGVSSDIWLATEGGRQMVVKQPLADLKVADEWHAPLARSRSEAEWLRVVGAAVPGACPRVLAFDPDENLLALEYLDPGGHVVWKQQLLQGIVDTEVAAAVGHRLGRIHAVTSADPALAATFATDDLFWDLRLEPYLQRLGERYPMLGPSLDTLIDTTRKTRFALVHGDVSPKNILVGPTGPVLLDAECAWWGDPAFDLAFCLKHLLLKCALPNAPVGLLLEAYDALIAAYVGLVCWEAPAYLLGRTASLLPALMLARVDGRSPVEYLDVVGRRLVRTFALPFVIAPPMDLAQIRDGWRSVLS